MKILILESNNSVKMKDSVQIVDDRLLVPKLESILVLYNFSFY